MTAPAFPRFKVYRRHACTAKHRTYRKLVQCMIPRAAWISGEGEYALIAWCSIPTITLYATADDALKAHEDLVFCGGRCDGRHEVVRIARGN